MGMSPLKGRKMDPRFEQLMNLVPADAVILGGSRVWCLSSTRKILIPVGGVEIHGELRARLLGSLFRTGAREITYLGIIPPSASRETEDLVIRRLTRLAHDTSAAETHTVVMKSEDVVTALLQHAALHDLLIMGLQRSRIGSRVLGKIPLEIAQNNPGAMILISQRGKTAAASR